MDHLYRLIDAVDRELEQMAQNVQSNGLTDIQLKRLKYLSHSLKCLECVAAMRDADYQGGNSYDDGSGNSGGMNSGRGYNRNRMGRFTGRRAHDAGRSARGTSYDGMPDHSEERESLVRAAEQFLEVARSN